MLAIGLGIGPFPIHLREIQERLDALVQVVVNRGLSIIGELLIETSEEVLGVVNRILSDNYRLPGLDRMLLPTAREV